ncbi:hypothetical protein FHW84_002530 [Dyella sp. SG562]|uniref:hypothetical protein n=1 Tax=Dyella sp. SG562 TaxID=2587017 RepID=UPI00141E150F|nr:hypothetical protein [Dyella sp. SG562]NII73957.1 hypothetical protein [Dyella sp. SG562]
MSEMTLEQELREAFAAAVTAAGCHGYATSRNERASHKEAVHQAKLRFNRALDAHLTRDPVQMTDGMVYASDVMAALRQVADFVFVHQGWELSNIHLWIEESFGESLSARMAQPMAAKVPEELPRNGVTVREHEYNAGWNDCREVMLSHMNESQPHSQAAQAAQGGEAQGKVVECGGCAPPIIAMHSAERAAVPDGKFDYDAVWATIRGFGYTTKGQTDEITDELEKLLCAAPTLARKEKG